MFGSELRCPKCNQYTPDRCKCKLVPVYEWLERTARAGLPEVEHAARTLMAFYQGADFPEGSQQEKDAARYRWLRTRARTQEVIDLETGCETETLDEQDAAIDAAVAALEQSAKPEGA